MTSLFERFMGRKEASSAEIAKERLKLVLVTDRSNLSSDKLEAMQTEIIEVIKRYIPIDEMEVQIKLEQRDRKNYLVADIPLHRDHSYEASSEVSASMPSIAETAIDPPDAASPGSEEPASEPLDDDPPATEN